MNFEQTSKTHASLLAFGILFSGAVAAVFLAGGPQEGGPGIFLVLAGIALLLCPPQIRLASIFWIILGGFLLMGAGTLLPQSWSSLPAWRSTLQGLPIPLATLRSPVPKETIFYLIILAISAILLLFGLSHPLRARAQLTLVTGGSLACLVYASLAIYAERTGWKYPFDEDPTFGFFPNRNHAATFLITGSILSLGVLGISGRDRKWLAGSVAAAALAVCVVALTIYSPSRGGVIFLIAGVLLWLAGLGKRSWSKPLLISFGAIFVAGTILFLVSGSAARSRLLQQIGWGDVSHSELAAKSTGSPSTTQKVALDGRIAIYQDTWRMICDAPVTGVGLGAFRYIYPFYQAASLSDATSAHPESDWLMLAAEAGIPSLLILLAAGAILLRRILSQAQHPYWPLRWGMVCAAMAAVLHGWVDVPAHRAPLGWWMLLLAAAGLQVFPREPRRPALWQRAVFWLAGLGAVAMGIFLIRAEWLGGPASPPLAAAKAGREIFTLFKKDQFEKASALATHAIAASPMVGSLYFQKAVLQLHFEGTDQEVDALFRAERALNPRWSRIPILQGQAWIDIDPARTATLWQDALQRKRRIDQARNNNHQSEVALFGEFLDQSTSHPELQRRLLTTNATNAAMILLGLEKAEKNLAAEEIPRFGEEDNFVGKLSAPDRRRFLQAWYQKADLPLLFSFLKRHPGWENDGQPFVIRQLADTGQYPEAVAEAAKFYKVDLDLNSWLSGQRKDLTGEEANPVEKFAYYWKAGNEVTARRILQEAGSSTPTAKKIPDEIWRLNAMLAIHDHHDDRAWEALRRYLRESGVDSSL